MKDYETDKSWGMIGASKVTGGGKNFFNSDIETPTFIEITLKTAQKARDLKQDWILGDDTLFRIKLTPIQWVNFLTCMNEGDGVPCTIEYTKEDGHIPFKPEKPRLDIIYEEHEAVVNSSLDSLNDLEEAIKELAPRISKKAYDELLHKVSAAKFVLTDKGLDFARTQAKRELDSMVNQAKANITAYTEMKIRDLGMEALRAQIPKLPDTVLDSGEDDNGN